jgi:hypothetical protein
MGARDEVELVTLVPVAETRRDVERDRDERSDGEEGR